MTTSERAEMTEVVASVFLNEFGGRAALSEVTDAVTARILDTQHLNEYLVRLGIKGITKDYFRQSATDGLPNAPEADKAGTHVQLELLTVPEFRYVIGRQLDNSAAARMRAQQYAERCHEIFGVWITVDALPSERRTA